MKPTRYKDYCHKEFKMDIPSEQIRVLVNARVWYSYEIKPQGIITEHLGETLEDSINVNFEIEDVFVENDGLELLTDEIERLVKQDYTQYFSLD